MYNVFIDDRKTGNNVAVFSSDSAYDASAVANHAADKGFLVYTDMWSEVIYNAMMSPEVWEKVKRYPGF